MKRTLLSTAFAVSVLGTLPSLQAADEIPRNAQVTLEQVVLPSYRTSNSLALLKGVSNLTARMNERQIEIVDDWLEDHNIPPVRELMTAARLRLVLQNNGRGLPAPTGRELLLVLGELRSQINKVYSERRNVEALSREMPRPRSMDAYEEMFWQVHVYSNRLNSAVQMANYGKSISRYSNKINRRHASEEDLKLLDVDFAFAAKTMESLIDRLQDRAIRLRIQRLRFAEQILAEDRDILERLKASFAVHIDQTLLSRQVREWKIKKTPEAAQLISQEQIDAIATRAKQSAGPLYKKSQLLFVGLHWWLRGRYGAGPEGGGLLKSEQALKSPQTEFALFMPAKLPVPNNPLVNPEMVPDVDRRHHYIWAFEDRSITSKTKLRAISTEQIEVDITTERFY